jgi:hypothetical protein
MDLFLERQFRKGQYHDLISALTNKIRHCDADTISVSQAEYLFSLYVRSLYLSSLSKTIVPLLFLEIEFDSDCNLLMQRMQIESVSFLSADLVLYRYVVFCSIKVTI